LPGTSGVLVRTYAFEVDHDFRRWLTGIGRFTYGTLDYQGDNGRTDKIYTLSGDLIYKLTRSLWLKGTVQRSWLDSSSPGSSSESTVVMVGVRLQRLGRLSPQPSLSCPRGGRPDAAAFTYLAGVSGILDHPPSRMIMTEMVETGECWFAAAYRGKSVFPIRNVSIARAHKRPSRIAQTTSDCPRRMSPAENTFGREVL
jgi:hypothetical protein